MIQPAADGYKLLLNLAVEPMAKPRMTQRYKWKKRPIVNRWNAYKDMIRLVTPSHFSLPYSGYWIIFMMSMPGSWSEEKRKEHRRQFHQSRPDKDNLEKGLLDIWLPEEDSIVADGRVTKLWGDVGRIEVWWKDA